MTVPQLLLVLNFVRSIIIIVVLCWLIFTRAKAPKMKTVCSSTLMVLLAFNLFSALAATLILEISLW